MPTEMDPVGILISRRPNSRTAYRVLRSGLQRFTEMLGVDSDVIV